MEGEPSIHQSSDNGFQQDPNILQSKQNPAPACQGGHEKPDVQGAAR
jgi:hypothetical protein